MSEQLAKLPAVLKIGERELVILKPTPRAFIDVDAWMTERAKAHCVSPLDYVVKQHMHLPPAAFAVAVSEAIKLGSGGGAKPTREAVWVEYSTLEGVRFQAWYHARAAHPDLKLEELTPLITPDNFPIVGDELDKALKLAALDPNAPAPATGPS